MAVEVIVKCVLTSFILFLYFLPSFIAYINEHNEGPVIFILNIPLGFTIIGWVVLLLWAVSDDMERWVEEGDNECSDG